MLIPWRASTLYLRDQIKSTVTEGYGRLLVRLNCCCAAEISAIKSTRVLYLLDVAMQSGRLALRDGLNIIHGWQTLTRHCGASERDADNNEGLVVVTRRTGSWIFIV
jgi:hypothetical protein